MRNESTLDRMGLDSIDIVYLHDPDDHLDQALGEGIQTLIELRDQGRLACLRPAELFDVQRDHAVEPVQVLGDDRRRADEGSGPGHPVREPCGDGERVRPAAGATGDREPVDAQQVGDGHHVSDAVDDRAFGVAVRRAVAGAVVGDQPGAGLDVRRLVGVAVQPAARRPVQLEHREPGRVAPLGEAQGPPVGGGGELRLRCHARQANRIGGLTGRRGSRPARARRRGAAAAPW